jgi:hypothetical protein
MTVSVSRMKTLKLCDSVEYNFPPTKPQDYYVEKKCWNPILCCLLPVSSILN